MKKVKMSIAAIVVCAAVVVGVMSMSANSNLSAGLMFDQIEALAGCEVSNNCGSYIISCSGEFSCSAGTRDGMNFVVCDNKGAASCTEDNISHD